jgi:hypothetical protein
MTKQDAGKLLGMPAIVLTVAAVLAYLIALAGFETKASHDADIIQIQQAHEKTDARIICLLQDIKTPAGRICP